MDLTWSGAEGALVELLRNDALVDLPNNDGAHRDTFRRYETSFRWKICEQRSSFCSNTVSVVFGNALTSSSGEPLQATIVNRGDDGRETSRPVLIELE